MVVAKFPSKRDQGRQASPAVSHSKVGIQLKVRMELLWKTHNQKFSSTHTYITSREGAVASTVFEDSMTTFRSTPLFGGALIADLPSTFRDVRWSDLPLDNTCWVIITEDHSNIRQVPDNQEVYLDKESLTSIVFDILERVGPPGSSDATDGTALTIHLEEIARSDVDTLKVWGTTSTKFSKLP
jgi:hypothetical protein